MKALFFSDNSIYAKLKEKNNIVSLMYRAKVLRPDFGLKSSNMEQVLQTFEFT